MSPSAGVGRAVPDAGLPAQAARSAQAAQAAQAAQVAVVIPARDEAVRIGETIDGVRHVPGVAAVIVVDDGSTDRTAVIASQHGAEVVRHVRGHGKADAMMSGLGRITGLRRVGRLDASASVLFIDADLEASAQAVGALVAPVASGQADLAIASLPDDGWRSDGRGGHGVVVGLAQRGIEELTGWSPEQPLSGMRCLSPAAIAAATPFARGWGVEVGMTIDVLDAGLTLVEVPCDLRHRAVGTDWRSQVHRAAQYRDIALALGVRRLRRRLGPG